MRGGTLGRLPQGLGAGRLVRNLAHIDVAELFLHDTQGFRATQ